MGRDFLNRLRENGRNAYVASRLAHAEHQMFYLSFDKFMYFFPSVSFAGVSV